MKYRILTVVFALTFSFAFTSARELNSITEPVKLTENIPADITNAEITVIELYSSFTEINSSMPALSVFEKAIQGYQKLDAEGKISNPLLTIIDFDLSSVEKRLWILNMDTQKVVFNDLVSHGKNTGVKFAEKFSNQVNSHQSSLGFYLTGETYYGKNGLSLFIDGLEKGFNSNARKRYVVIHGADYAEPSFVKRVGRLGRSYGCPAIPNSIAKNLINTIKGKSVVYIHKSDSNYQKKSTFLNS
ncbi:murein L,D-transpeptidase catalytic domain family protein [Gramella sp. AN32]|uniref:Murein L,D-transpeptidase catalytic domain family protein n=1 Tax=Christiangramia antarctica TaxID=2058158 RepID=A0ABW5X8B4_9FLAO|nr:murein L,D-transpeptidase catalytic domain family protein [Gramella sp. AN32]MCM4154787.1 hypothetical protein [Gramella sp. AN32]